jgi:hypothetical protein
VPAVLPFSIADADADWSGCHYEDNCYLLRISSSTAGSYEYNSEQTQSLVNSISTSPPKSHRRTPNSISHYVNQAFPSKLFQPPSTRQETLVAASLALALQHHAMSLAYIFHDTLSGHLSAPRGVAGTSCCRWSWHGCVIGWSHAWGLDGVFSSGKRASEGGAGVR